jgi:hypothetical protein
LDQAPFVVATFVPRVRKENMDPFQTVVAQHMVHHLDSIVLHDTDIANVFLATTLEQSAHAWRMNFAAQKVVVRTRVGNLGSGVAHAESDFQNKRRLATKGSCNV